MARLATRHEEAGEPLVPLAGGEDSFFDSLFDSLSEAGFASALVSLFAASPPELSGLLAVAFFPVFLKSVAYQPLPLSWKPAAVSIFVNVSLPHAVQTVSGASLHFWRNSCWWPQLEHLYS